MAFPDRDRGKNRGRPSSLTLSSYTVETAAAETPAHLVFQMVVPNRFSRAAPDLAKSHF